MARRNNWLLPGVLVLACVFLMASGCTAPAENVTATATPTPTPSPAPVAPVAPVVTATPSPAPVVTTITPNTTETTVTIQHTHTPTPKPTIVFTPAVTMAQCEYPSQYCAVENKCYDACPAGEYNRKTCECVRWVWYCPHDKERCDDKGCQCLEPVDGMKAMRIQVPYQ